MIELFWRLPPGFRVVSLPFLVYIFFVSLSLLYPYRLPLRNKRFYLENEITEVRNTYIKT